jgi:DNA-binding response OmpR family regulator
MNFSAAVSGDAACVPSGGATGVDLRVLVRSTVRQPVESNLGNGMPLRGKDVLLIDHVSEDSRAYAAFLTQAGARVACVSTLAAGRRSLRERAADLLLMHLRLPDGDALQWLERQDEHDETRIPCVLLSGLFDERSYRRAYEVGAVPLPKQYVVHPDVLLAAIDSAFKLARAPLPTREV